MSKPEPRRGGLDDLSPKGTQIPQHIKVRELGLFNPWTHFYHVYKLDSNGLRQIHTFGPLGKRDAKRFIKDYS